MGWLGRLVGGVQGAAPTHWTMDADIAASGVPGIGEPFDADECYVEFYIESLRLARARRFATRFNGVAYSFIRLAREGEKTAEVAAVSKPERLTDLDPGSLDRVITVSKQMMGAMPWRGGTLGLELGLFSVKAGNLLTPVLDYVTRVSSTAGVSFIGQIQPFLPLITEGMDLIAGQTADREIEIAIDTDMSVQKSVVGAIVALPQGQVPAGALRYDGATGQLSANGRPVEAGYCVYSIRRVAQKADWGEIPELKKSYALLRAAIGSGRRKEADEALTAFRQTALSSPDLTMGDALKLVGKATALRDAAFPGGGVAAGAVAAPPEAMAGLDLYG